MDKGYSVASLFEKISKRQIKILENLDKQQCNELLNQLLSNIFNLQVKIWKKCLRKRSKLSDKKNIKTKT